MVNNMFTVLLVFYLTAKNWDAHLNSIILVRVQSIRPNQPNNNTELHTDKSQSIEKRQ